MLQLCWGPSLSVDGYLESSSLESDFAWEPVGSGGDLATAGRPCSPAGSAVALWLRSFLHLWFSAGYDGVLSLRFIYHA